MRSGTTADAVLTYTSAKGWPRTHDRTQVTRSLAEQAQRQEEEGSYAVDPRVLPFLSVLARGCHGRGLARSEALLAELLARLPSALPRGGPYRGTTSDRMAADASMPSPARDHLMTSPTLSGLRRRRSWSGQRPVSLAAGLSDDAAEDLELGLHLLKISF